jgi:ribonuclease PH
MNVVATDSGTFVELQGTGESATFARSTLDQMLDLALKGCQELTECQNTALAASYPGELPR